MSQKQWTLIDLGDEYKDVVQAIGPKLEEINKLPERVQIFLVDHKWERYILYYGPRQLTEAEIEAADNWARDNWEGPAGERSFDVTEDEIKEYLNK